METLDAFLSSHGYWVFFAVGFAEFLGVPIVSVPVLIAGGALVASGTLGFWGVVVSVAAGGWLADLGWYTAGRRQGPWLIGVACRLSSNPTECLSTVRRRLARVGTPYVLLAKMLPGSGNLIAVVAGAAGFKILPFALADAAALILWATIYTGTGWIFADEVAPAVEWALTYNRAIVLTLTLIVVATVWRSWPEGSRRAVFGGIFSWYQRSEVPPARRPLWQCSKSTPPLRDRIASLPRIGSRNTIASSRSSTSPRTLRP